MKRLYIIIIMIYMGFLTFSLKGDNFTSGSFLNISFDARGTAMGNSLVAFSKDGNSIYWNPSGLAYLKNSEVILSHIIWLFDTDYEYLSLSHNIANYGVASLSVGFLSLPDVEDKYFTHSVYNNSSFVAGISYGYNLENILHIPLSIGLTTKFVYEKLASINGSTLGVDVGIMYEIIKEKFMSGIVVKNIGGSISFDEYKNSLPLKVEGGVSYIYKLKNKVINSINITSKAGIVNSIFIAGGGVEILLNKFTNDIDFALRSGIEYPYSLFNIGAGIKWKMMKIDYSFSVMRDNIGYTHKFSLKFSI